MILNQIVANTKKELKETMRKLPLNKLRASVKKMPKKKHLFLRALSDKKQPIHLICELKRKSPSAGTIRKSFPFRSLTNQFERGGASAISVLTDKKYFGGSQSILSDVKKTTSLPILRKDFIVDPYQVYESLRLGADAFLLIASVLDQKKLKELVGLGKSLGLDPLVEIRNRNEFKKALASGADIIGINNRNLNTMKVNSKYAESLIPLFPKNKIIVIESGIDSFEDAEPYLQRNVRNFLVGTALMKSKNIKQKLTQLLGKTK